MAHKILVVDDEPDILQLTTLRLQAGGFQVVTASAGPEALDKARREKPDLIVLDLMLPGLNGYEICTMLKQDTRYQEIPIILFTAKAQEKDEKLGMECGANAYLRKPFKGEELEQKIQSLLAARPAANP